MYGKQQGDILEEALLRVVWEGPNALQLLRDSSSYFDSCEIGQTSRCFSIQGMGDLTDCQGTHEEPKGRRAGPGQDQI